METLQAFLECFYFELLEEKKSLDFPLKEDPYLQNADVIKKKKILPLKNKCAQTRSPAGKLARRFVSV